MAIRVWFGAWESWEPERSDIVIISFGLDFVLESRTFFALLRSLVGESEWHHVTLIGVPGPADADVNKISEESFPNADESARLLSRWHFLFNHFILE